MSSSLQLTIMQPTVAKVVQAMSLGKEGLFRLHCIVLLAGIWVSPRFLYKVCQWLIILGVPTYPTKYNYITIGCTHPLVTHRQFLLTNHPLQRGCLYTQTSIACPGWKIIPPRMVYCSNTNGYPAVFDVRITTLLLLRYNLTSIACGRWSLVTIYGKVVRR